MFLQEQFCKKSDEHITFIIPISQLRYTTMFTSHSNLFSNSIWPSLIYLRAKQRNCTRCQNNTQYMLSHAVLIIFPSGVSCQCYVPFNNETNFPSTTATLLHWRSKLLEQNAKLILDRAFILMAVHCPFKDYSYGKIFQDMFQTYPHGTYPY